MASLRPLPTALLASLAFAGFTACGSDAPTPTIEGPPAIVATLEPVPEGTFAEEATEGTTEVVDQVDVSIPTVRYSWDPSAGDKEVSAEMGGPGFTGEGWTTNMEFPAIGSADAIKGGDIKMYLTEWPVTMRLQGQNWNTAFNYRARDLCTEGLVQQHPATLEYIPALATHWQISEDMNTFRFRINPSARWSDGKEVTSADVLATYKLALDDTILMPSNKISLGKVETPVAISKYIVEVKSKQTSWRNFMYIGTLAIQPAHQISIPGGEYLELYQNKYTAVTGPYTLDPETKVLNKSIQLRRRSDWWDKDNPAWRGMWNFDTYSFVVVQDYKLAFEKAKKGEIDYYTVPKSQWWVEELTADKVPGIKRGLIQKRKFYNHAPVGTSGLALNTTRPPLDDLNIRKALAMLRDRPTMIDQLFFNEYESLSSYWQGGDYHNPANEMVSYDPFGAVELLTEAGWTDKDSGGYRIKDGERLSFEMMYRSPLSEPSLTVFKEDCQKAGIEIELKLFDSATHWKNVRARTYDIASQNWGALIFPNPETSYSSALAAQIDNNNITAFSNPRVDELLLAYDTEFNVAARAGIIREIDGIVFSHHPYVLDWYNPAQRVIYWNKFSMPKWGVTRFTDNSDMMYTWWVDPVKAADLQAAKDDETKTLETEPIEHRFWDAWMKSQAKK